jgi:hypothetical protein
MRKLPRNVDSLEVGLAVKQAESIPSESLLPLQVATTSPNTDSRTFGISIPRTQEAQPALLGKATCTKSTYTTSASMTRNENGLHLWKPLGSW